MLKEVGADCVGILSLWREPATEKLATASSCPNAGTASIVANAVPDAPVPPADVPTIVATCAVHTAKFAVVKGDALVCIHIDATKPGKTFEGNAIFNSPD
jgi:hypothetical protein